MTKQLCMNAAVIRRIIEISSAEMLSDKARAAGKRKRAHAAAAASALHTPVPDDGEEPPSDIEALHEAETAIGIATWLDPETGEPARGACPPHLDEP